MKWLWLIVSVVFGYIFSQVINMVLVLGIYSGGRSGSILLSIASVFVLGFGGLATGYLIGLISRRLKMAGVITVAGLVITVTAINLYLDRAIEPVSHKIIILFAMAPAIIIGSRFVRAKQDVRAAELREP